MVWRNGQKSQAARDVIREAERILHGRTLESYIARRERVPAWSLIALLAHSSRLDLMRLAHPAANPDPSGWSGTVARLAVELLECSCDEPSLLRLQRSALVPLELNLLGGMVSPPCSPADLFQMVTGALERPLSPEF